MAAEVLPATGSRLNESRLTDADEDHDSGLDSASSRANSSPSRSDESSRSSVTPVVSRSPSPDRNSTDNADLGLTAEMIEENKRVQRQLMEEEEKKRQDLLKEADKSDDGKKYKQLEFLLQKSTMYTKYLFSRMEGQREDMRIKSERKRKKEEKRAKKKQTEETKQKEANKENEDEIKKPGGRGRGKRRRVEDDDEEKMAEEGQSAKKTKMEMRIEVEVETKAKGEAKVDTEEEQLITTLNEDGLLHSIENISEILSGVRKDSYCRAVNGERISDMQPVLFTGGVLREYQIKGYTWMKSLFQNGINGILADEMGLGKTIQCIALVARLITDKCEGPFLVVAPLSTIPNWYSEFRRFTPKIPVMIHHGGKDARLAKVRKMKEKHRIGPYKTRPVVITSYEMVIQDRPMIGNFPWMCLIVDEGHRIKNMNCRLIRELKQFNASNRLLLTGTPLQNNLSELWSLLNFLLPEIFDDLESFHSWFDMTMVTEQGGEARMREEMVKAERENKVLTMLHEILEPFLLRRLKTDVHLDIPPKREVLVYAPMTPTQADFYQCAVDRTIQTLVAEKNAKESEDIFDHVDEDLENYGRGKMRASRRDVNYAFFEAGSSKTERGNLIRGKDYSRKIYADESSDEEEDEENDKDGEKKEKSPAGKKKKNPVDDWYEQISKMTEERERNRVEVKSTTLKSNIIRIQLRNVMMLLRRCVNHPFLIDWPMTEMDSPTEAIVNVCGKMMILDQMLVHLKKGGHKVLIFSQMTQCLDIIADYLDYRNFDHSRLDGSMSMEDRQENIAAFNADPERFVFLLSTRAGGLGLNLMAADTVIIYDSDWNPQCDLQAQDRAHRVGQTRPVMVYRFTTANTIDQRIIERASAKRKLEKMVMRKGRFQEADKAGKATKKDSAISTSELLDLLQQRDQEREIKTSEKVQMSGKVQWTLTDSDLDALLDRSELYNRWEEERARRRAVDEARKKGEDEEAAIKAVEAAAALHSKFEAKQGNKLFSVVADISGSTLEDFR